MRRLALLVLVGCAKAPPPPAASPVGAAVEEVDLAAPTGPWDLRELEVVDGPAVALRFGWTPGDEAAVHHEVVALQLNGDVMSSRTRTSADWTETWVAAKDGYRFGARDGEAEVRIEPPPPAAEVLQAVMAALTLASVESVVDEEARWVAMDGASALRSEVAGKLAPLFDALPPPNQRALTASLEAGLTDEILADDAERRWQALVGAWLGQEYSVGDRSERVLDGGQLEVTTFVGWAPCAPEAVEPECALLERRVTAGELEVVASRERLLDTLRSTWPVDRPLPELLDSELETVERLLTEPATLHPRARFKRKVQTHTLQVEGRPIPWGQDIRTGTTWTWTRESP